MNRPHNRVAICPVCKGKLIQHKHPCISDNGFAYRSRRCVSCGAVIHTKQPPEEMTGLDAKA